MHRFIKYKSDIRIADTGQECDPNPLRELWRRMKALKAEGFRFAL